MSGTASAPRASSDSISRRVSPPALPASVFSQGCGGSFDEEIVRLGRRLFKVKGSGAAASLYCKGYWTAAGMGT